MSIPRDRGRAGSGRTERTESAQADAIGNLGHCSCCLIGLAVAAVVAVSLYPVLVAVTRPFGLLSSTALLVILVVVWLAGWWSFEIAWVWRVKRAERADG